MSLVNTATGQRLLLATHLATKWRALAGIEDKLDQAFSTELTEFSAPWGSTAWRLEYETEEPSLDEELRKTTERHASPGVSLDTPWFYEMLQSYAVFCRSVPDDSESVRAALATSDSAGVRGALARAIDASLLAWSRGKEPSEEQRSTIEAGVMRGDIDAVIAPALVTLFTEIERGGRPARTTPPVASMNRLDRLQRRILEIWADSMRQASVLDETAEGVRAGQDTAKALVRASTGVALTADELDILEALAIGEGRLGRALRRALEVCRGQAGC